MARFFISYSRKNKDFVNLLRKKLDAAEHRVWIDSSSIGVGQNYQVAIDDAIRGSDALLAVFSKTSLNNSYVNYEWAYALGARVPVIPMVLEDVTLHPRLEAINFIDVRPENRRRWIEIIRSLGAFEKGRRDIASGVGSGNVQPMLVARLKLDENGRPSRIPDSREWRMSLYIRKAGPITRVVKYEILDDTFNDPKWTNSSPGEMFRDDMSSYGDVAIKAKGFSRRGEIEPMWAVEGSLYRALLRGHRGRRSESVAKALEYIRTH